MYAYQFLFVFFGSHVLSLVSLIPFASGHVCPGFQSQCGFPCFCALSPVCSWFRRSPLVWHLLISWQPEWWLSRFDPRTCMQELVGLESRVLYAYQLPFRHFRAGSVVVSGTITLNCVQVTCNAAVVQSTLSSIATINGETVNILTVSGLFLFHSVYS